MTKDISKTTRAEIPTERTPLVDFIKFNNDNSSWKTEFLWLAKNCLPVIGTYSLQNSLQFASVITLGHLGATELAAAALGSMFASVTAWSTCFGMASALDTLCSQAWTGAKDKTLVGLHLQRALLILSIMFIPIAIIWLNATNIFIYLNQEPDLALHAGIFLKYLLIGAPFFIAFECVKKYVQAQGIMKAPSYVLMITAPLNVIMNYTFVHVAPFKLGFIGAPLATSFSYMIMFTLLILYIKFVDGKQAWGGWKRECLSDWGPFLKLAYPGVISISAEWWAFELSALCASYLSTVDLAAQSILLTAGSFTYTLPFSTSVATSNRVGNCLGAMAPLRAKRAAGTALVFAIAFGMLNSTFFIATRSWFGYLFTSDEDVVKRVGTILPICALFQIADGLAGVSGGVIRGIGKQKISAFLNLFAYYGIAAPVGYILTFKLNLELTGIWIGLTAALFLSSSTQMTYLWRVNWEKESKAIHYRIQQAEDKIHDNHRQDSIDAHSPLLETV